MDLTRNATEARPTVPYWAATSLAAAGAVITWCFTSDSSHGDFYMIGPYQVPLLIEYFVGGIAVSLGLAALRASARPTRATGALSRPTTAVLVLTAITSAGLWRVMTQGVIGANIGAGMAALAGPILIAALLLAAVCTQRSTAGMRTRTFVGLSVLALGTGPVLCATLWYGLAP